LDGAGQTFKISPTGAGQVDVFGAPVVALKNGLKQFGVQKNIKFAVQGRGRAELFETHDIRHGQQFVVGHTNGNFFQNLFAGGVQQSLICCRFESLKQI